jgi:hypothetical protein
MSHGGECIQHIANQPTNFNLTDTVTSWADEVWEGELMRQSQMAAGIAALSPAQRIVYEAASAAARAEQEAYTTALMARLAAERMTATAFQAQAEHPMLRLREAEEGAQQLSSCWAMEDALWDQPFSSYLEERYGGLYDCSYMPERDYAAFMQWLFSNGFEACAQSHRGLVRACWADLPARHWKPTQAAKWRPQEGTIQRFCIKCPPGQVAEGCMYVHGDVIQRVNFPCKFALTCKGTKRAACLHMHPDETWTPDMVVRRLPATAVAGEPAISTVAVPAPVVPVPAPQVQEPVAAYEGAWDAEDFQAPEVQIVTVTAEEVTLEERNKRNRLVQAGL